MLEEKISSCTYYKRRKVSLKTKKTYLGKRKYSHAFKKEEIVMHISRKKKGIT